MLAKRLLIENLIKQRNFIEEQLTVEREDGDTMYRYTGYLIPEVRKYFENEGFWVETVTGVIETRFLPVNLFTPNVELSAQELDLAKSY